MPPDVAQFHEREEPMQRFRELTEKDVVFSVEAEPEHIPIEGNAMASGDDAADQECYDWIHAELDRGNEWAWCSVKVTAAFGNFEGTAYLGACSYKSEADFREPGGYFDDLKTEALDDLNQQWRDALDKAAAILGVPS